MGNEYNVLAGALMVFHEFCDKNSELEFTYWETVMTRSWNVKNWNRILPKYGRPIL